MTTEQYKVFYKVVEHGSISKAAKALFVSQPAVTKSIQMLENELEIKLFVRNPKGVSLTREGEVLYTYVKEAFEQLELGEKRIEELKGRTYGSVRIGISHILCKFFFMPHLRSFHEHYPKLKIEIVNRTSLETLELLDNGKIDCAIISEVADRQRYRYHELMKIQDTFAAKIKPPQEKMSIQELSTYPLLLLEKKNSTRQHYEEHFMQHQCYINPDIEISSMEFLIDFAKIGLGVSAVIQEFVQKEFDKESLFEWKVDPPLSQRNIGLLYKKSDSLSIAAKTFIDFMTNKKML